MFPDHTGQLRPVSKARNFVTGRVVAALMLREMATTYGRSPGGYIWTVLEPVLGIAFLTVVFTLAFRSPPLGSNFPIFYATGVVPFVLFTDVSNKMAAALNFSRPLMTYPRVTFFDALLGRFLLNFLTQMLVGYAIFAFILIAYDTHTTLSLPDIAMGMAMAGSLGFGLGTLNCYLSSRFEIWARVWAIATRPLFIISGIFFTFESLPEMYRDYLWFNPLIHVTAQMRTGFYPYYEGTFISPAYVFGLSLICTAMGLIFLRRGHRDILNL